MVIALHVADLFFTVGEPVGSYRWNTGNVISSLTRCAIPLFVMISGSLFLDPRKEIGLKTLYGRYILRIATAFIFWSGLYAALQYSQGIRVRTVVRDFVTGGVHLWFLYMIVGMYIVTPLLRKIANSKNTRVYFLALWIATTVLYNTLRAFFSILSPRVTPWLDTAAAESDLYLAYGYTGFFVLGWYLREKELTKTVRRVIYALGILGAAFTVAATHFFSKRNGILDNTFYNNMTVGITLQAVALFVFFKYNVKNAKSGRTAKAFAKASSCVFGTYLVHQLFVNNFDRLFGFGLNSFDPILSFLAVFCIVTVCSAAVSYVFNLIPGVKKYLV
ncbi:MAG: acyltransferase family protein [Clostridia bacterium]|nr:acyltransferase family protein [Clostridia bacterium]